MPKIRLHKKIADSVKLQNLEYTNPEIQRNIKNFGIFLDGELTFNRLEWVLDFQEISFSHWPKREVGNFNQVKILREEKEFLVLFKPQNVVVEPGAGHQKDNLVSWLEENYNFKPFLVHRLDKDTQGLILIAKSENSQKFFQDQFRNREVEKKYFVVVDNLVENMWITTHFQTRDKQNMIKQKIFWDEQDARNFDQNYRQAHTIIKPKIISKDLNQSLIEVKIKTGRMHQIRVLCEALGFAVSKDKVYNQKIKLSKKDLNNYNIQKKFSLQSVQKLTVDHFRKKKKEIFGETEYCLLSNFIKIKTPSGEIMESNWKEI